jgi:hypothetical protein
MLALAPRGFAKELTRDRTLPGSTGVRRVEGANLFFPEEMPELFAEEATRLWSKPRRRRTEVVQ